MNMSFPSMFQRAPVEVLPNVLPMFCQIIQIIMTKEPYFLRMANPFSLMDVCLCLLATRRSLVSYLRPKTMIYVIAFSNSWLPHHTSILPGNLTDASSCSFGAVERVEVEDANFGWLWSKNHCLQWYWYHLEELRSSVKMEQLRLLLPRPDKQHMIAGPRKASRI